MKHDIIVREYSLIDYQDIVSAGYPFDLTDLRSQHGWKGRIWRIIYFLARLDRKVLVAYSTKDRKTVGIITLTKITDRIWGLWNIFVSPPHRREGISTQLYQKCFEFLRNKRVKKAVGSVTTDNIASIRGIEKTWDRFLSQKFYYYYGNLPSIPLRKMGNIIVRTFYNKDRKNVFRIYNKDATEDWKKSLEIAERNFLDRFIGKIYGKGFSRLLFAKEIFIAEYNENIVGYVIATRRRFLAKTSDVATLFMFFDPQLSDEAITSSIAETLSTLATKGVKTFSIYALADDENTMGQILANLNITPQTLMVPIIEL